MIVRADHSDNFTVMSNYHLRDKQLSLKAKGLLSWVLSCSDDWVFSTTGIIEVMKESKDAIKATLKELEDRGYLERKDLRTGGKFTGTDFVFYELPQTENPLTEKPQTEKPPTENPSTENPPLINTNKTNTKKRTTKNSLAKAKEGSASEKSKIISEVYSNPENAHIVEALRKYHSWRKDNHYGFHASTFIKWAEILRNEAKGNPDKAMAIVDQSIGHDWKSLYPLKNDFLLVGKYQPKKSDPALDDTGKPIVY